MISKALLDAILAQYQLPPTGIHGVPHWARVAENGRLLSEATGARRDVVTLFAFLHDACRLNEGWDSGRAPRSAELVVAWRRKWIELPRRDFDLLYMACAMQTEGRLDGDVTLQTCWDADRLDIGRVGAPVIVTRLCTDAAREPGMIALASERSRRGFAPEWLGAIWSAESALQGGPAPQGAGTDTAARA